MFQAQPLDGQGDGFVDGPALISRNRVHLVEFSAERLHQRNLQPPVDPALNCTDKGGVILPDDRASQETGPAPFIGHAAEPVQPANPGPEIIKAAASLVRVVRMRVTRKLLTAFVLAFKSTTEKASTCPHFL